MTRLPFVLQAFRVFLAAATVALVVACESAEGQRVEETRQRLVGSWLHEAELGNLKSRRILVLGTDGKFRENIRIAAADGTREAKDFGGEWSYDGTNLKRRYLQEDGRQFAGGSMKFATFPLLSVSASELAVGDTIKKEKVTYRRVPEGTQP